MKKAIKIILRWLFTQVPLGKKIIETRNTAAPITLNGWFMQKVLGFNREAYWPASFTSKITGVPHIFIGIGTAPGLSHGCYIFAKEGAEIYVGDYTIIAPNVCIAGFNHNLYNYSQYESKGPVRIGKYCWLSMNCCILPGVELGAHTIVAAGSVVTRSYSEGYCVLAGNPARIIKKLEKEQCVENRNQYEYIGYFPKKLQGSN